MLINLQKVLFLLPLWGQNNNAHYESLQSKRSDQNA